MAKKIMYVNMDGVELSINDTLTAYRMDRELGNSIERRTKPMREWIMATMGDTPTCVTPDNVATISCQNRTVVENVPADVQAKVDKLLAPYKVSKPSQVLKVVAR